jgi:hypothetical protein
MGKRENAYTSKSERRRRRRKRVGTLEGKEI